MFKVKVSKYSSVYHLTEDGDVTLCGLDIDNQKRYAIIDEHMCSKCQNKEKLNGETKTNNKTNDDKPAEAINWRGKLATW